MYMHVHVGLHASKMQVAKDQADIIFPNKNDTVFENATFSATDATVIIPGSLLLERGKECKYVHYVQCNLHLHVPYQQP